MASRAHTPGDPATIRDPFQIAPESLLSRVALGAARPFLSMLGLDELRHGYLAARSATGPTFEARVLRTLDVRYRVDAVEHRSIPTTGPLIVAANHPTGALDGIVLMELVRQVRTDVRVLANHLLARIPELRESCFFVDPFGGSQAGARSRTGLRDAHAWLRGGGALVMFPAGEVAWRDRYEDTSRVVRPSEDHFNTCPLVVHAGLAISYDSPWHATVGRLALATGAQVLPVFLDGRNSRVFHAAGRVHPLLRTMLLGRELLNKRGTTVHVRVGRPVTHATAAEREQNTSASTATDSIRRAVDLLGAEHRSAAREVEIEPSLDPTLLERDVAALPEDARLLTSGTLDVYCAGAASLPHVLREIGRLRELSFRAVGEGTGRPIDIDEFDEHYRHLFVWNRARAEVVGAYRVGGTDLIVPARGVSGLYTRTLFRYDERMLERLGPALELGRSFVRPEYQRSYNALLLLWKGIGRVVAQSPQYRVLFGAVSISGRYRETSQQLLRAFLTQEHSDTALAALVEPLTAPPAILPPGRAAALPADVDELDALITQIEGRRGIPVLLRQYMRLNATLLGFNVDPAFGDALDALMMVDLTRLPESTLQRYLGADAAAFLAYHARPTHAAA